MHRKYKFSKNYLKATLTDFLRSLKKRWEFYRRDKWFWIILLFLVFFFAYLTNRPQVIIGDTLGTKQPELKLLTPLEGKRVQVTTSKVKVIPTPYKPVINGNCMDWIRQAGVSDVQNAYELIMRESGCNPNAVNPSSGACGLGQQLPCGKWPHKWNDPVGGIIDMQGYVFARYGSWANANSFQKANNYY